MSVVLRGTKKEVHIPFLIYVMRKGGPYEVSFSTSTESLRYNSLYINDAKLYTVDGLHDLLSNEGRRSVRFSKPDSWGIRWGHFRFQAMDIDYKENPVITVELDVTLQPNGTRETIKAEFEAWENSYITWIVLHYANI